MIVFSRPKTLKNAYFTLTFENFLGAMPMPPNLHSG